MGLFFTIKPVYVSFFLIRAIGAFILSLSPNLLEEELDFTLAKFIVLLLLSSTSKNKAL